MLRVLSLVCLLAVSSVAHALEINLSAILSDGMILQRGQAVPIWGSTDAGAKVSVQFDGQAKTTIADTNGEWRVDLDAMAKSSESRPLLIAASLNNERAEHAIEDVLVGEVWLASGQSNMYWRFRMLMGTSKDEGYEVVQEYLIEEVEKANDTLLRQFTAGRVYSPYEVEQIGRGGWSKAIKGEINEFSGTGYFFARELRRELDVPVAIISSNVGGTRIEPWIAPSAYRTDAALSAEYDREIDALKQRASMWDNEEEMNQYREAKIKWEKAQTKGKKGSKAPRKPTHPDNNTQNYGSLFNGMIHPFIPYAMKGAIWYQGESNTGNYPNEYAKRLHALVNGWRDAWEQEEFHFYWCQLSNYKQANEEPHGDEDTWAVVQNQQRLGLNLADTGMAVLNDIGQTNDIHPRNKMDAGKRLSLWALKKAYNKDLIYSGPLYKESKCVGSKVFIKFDHVGAGLMAGKKSLLNPVIEVDESLKRFQIRGTTGEWKWADAEIYSKDIVVVSHREIPQPKEVRYAWSSNPEGANLYNKSGLPTSIFKTDDLQKK